MAMSSTPLSPAHSGNQAGMATGELSDWVNRVRSGSQVNSSGSPAATDFEEEVRQSRLARQQRQKRLSNQGISGIEGPATYDAPQSGSRPTSSGGLQMDTMSHDSPAPSRRGAALLSRYGGQAGPTGTANAGSGGSPVSLANFMGGRAAGPRLGKLAGDGRSAPPEADMIDDSRLQRRVALPGMSPTKETSGAGRSLASFLEARATGRENAASPAAAAASFAPSSPTRASPTIRAASPTRGQTEPMPAPASRQSPVRRSTSPSKRANSPEKLSAPMASPITVPRPGYERALSSNAEMKHAATSPIKFDEPGVKSITPSAAPTPMATPKSAAPTGSTTSAPMSPAFAQLQRANSDRQPTPSLTRLQGKGMVGQRLKEAKEREAAASSSPSSGSSVPGRITVPRSQPQSPSKWGTVESTPSSPVPAASTSPSAERRWQRSGNALPGLSRPSSSSAGAGVGAFRSPSPTRESHDDREFAPPVRLPGMGGASSPFGASGGRAASPTKVATDEGGADKPLEHLTASRARGPVKRSARTPAAAAAAAAAEPAAEKAPEVVPAPVANVETTPSVQSQAPPAPLRSTIGPRIAVLISGSGSNLQALIDATHVPQGLLSHAHVSFVLSNRKAAYGLTRASTSNPPIPTEILALKTWQNRNPGGTREQYDEVLAKAVLTGGGGSGGQGPDLIVLAGFMHIVSPVFLRALGHDTDLPNSGAPAWRPAKPVPIINLHPALPGAFDGANAIPRAFEAFQKGEVDKTGIMVHEVVAEVDRGAPVLVREVPIGKQDTLETLEEKMHSVEHELIVEATAVMLQTVKEGTATTKRATPAAAAKAPAAASPPRPRVVPLKRHGDSATFAQLSRNAKDVLLQPRTRRHNQKQTISVETLLIQSDGPTRPLAEDEAHILYEGDAQAIVHRYKASPGAELAQTTVYARVGVQAKDSAKVRDVARRYGSSAQLVDARQGKEPEELALLFPGGVLETRRGASRAAWDKGDSMLWRVSAKLSSEGAAATFIDQVELRTSSLTSASSFVLSVVGTVLVWHGRGAYDVERDAARRYARDLSGGKVSEMEEGEEDGGAKGLWWSVLNGAGKSDEAREYAQAWHHRRRRAQALVDGAAAKEQQTPRLLVIRPGTGELEEVNEASAAFTSSDIPQTGVSLVHLPSSSEIYILIGPDARGQRSDISVALQAAEALQQQTRSTAAHVVVYPSTTPRDLSQALRYWSSYEAGLRRGAKGINVVGLKQAKKELLEWKEVDERLLQDLKALPVGVDETEVL